MRRIFRIFLIAWACVFLVSFFTASNSISFVQRILFSGALALVVPALSFGKAHSKKQATAKSNHTFPQDVDIHLPLDPKVLYRVRNGKIYRGMDAAPIYEIRDNNIYPVLSSKLAFLTLPTKATRCVSGARREMMPPLSEKSHTMAYRRTLF